MFEQLFEGPIARARQRASPLPAAKWERERNEMQKNLRQRAQKRHKLIESEPKTRGRKRRNCQESQSLGRLAQLVRARASHARGHRFESCSAHHLNYTN
jgi:hypothetical protein